MNISKSRKAMYIISIPIALIITLILFVIGIIILLITSFSTNVSYDTAFVSVVLANILAWPFVIHILLIQLLFWFDFFTQLSRKNRLEIKKIKEIKD